MSGSELSDDDTSLELPAVGESTKEGKNVTQGGLWNGVFCNESDSDTNEKSKSDSNTAPHESIILLNAIEERKWGSVSNSNLLSFWPALLCNRVVKFIQNYVSCSKNCKTSQ